MRFKTFESDSFGQDINLRLVQNGRRELVEISNQ